MLYKYRHKSVFCFLLALLIMLVVIFLSACSNQIDHRFIFGRWKAERLQLQGLYLPMGPDFSITEKNIISINGEIDIPISDFTEKNNSVIINGPLGVGFEFHLVSNDRIFFKLPVIGNIYFNRVLEISSPKNAPSDTLDRKEEISAVGLSSSSTSIVPHSQDIVSTNSNISTASPPTLLSVEKIAVKLNSASDDPVYDVAAFVHLAEDQLYQGKISEAETTLAAAVRKFGNFPMIDYQFAELRIRQNNADEAIRYLTIALQNGFNQSSKIRGNIYFAPLKSDPRFFVLMDKYQ